jgi:hypothetical protein
LITKGFPSSYKRMAVRRSFPRNVGAHARYRCYGTSQTTCGMELKIHAWVFVGVNMLHWRISRCCVAVRKLIGGAVAVRCGAAVPSRLHLLAATAPCLVFERHTINTAPTYRPSASNSNTNTKTHPYKLSTGRSLLRDPLGDAVVVGRPQRTHSARLVSH